MRFFEPRRGLRVVLAEVDRSRLLVTSSELQAAAAALVMLDLMDADGAEEILVEHRRALELDAVTAGYEGQVGRLRAQFDSATAQVASAERIAEVYQREAEILAQQIEHRPSTGRRKPAANS